MTDPDCIFCRIVAGDIPAQVIHRDETVIAIADVNPQAPQHLLVMPFRHFSNIAEFAESASPEEVQHLLRLAASLGSREYQDGYRMVVNTGPAGGQTVGHLHVHVLAGRHMHWPPG